tara:strand:- start:1234 stop:2118 length:885 start_codon:yes stop_codon:yes gene_type:complete
MALKKLADDDTLGNKSAHFFKSGNIVRTDENEKLTDLKNLLPKTGNWHTPLEYDIWYNIGEEHILGYTYTDCFSKCLMLRPASTEKSNRAMALAAREPVTDDGMAIFNELKNNSQDKYKLSKKKQKEHKFVIFLPGTNIIDKVLDYDKTKRALKQGAVLKCHPLTAPGMVAYLRSEFGRDKVLDKKISGHKLLEEASIVGCCTNSEMGILALTKGKSVYLFDKVDDQLMTTYKAIYNAVWGSNDQPSVERLQRLFSAKYSGLVPYFIDNPQERIDYFFNFWKSTPHALSRPRKK